MFMEFISPSGRVNKMKANKLFLVFPILISGLSCVACSNKPQYKEDFIFSGPDYEPVQIARNDEEGNPIAVQTITAANIPDKIMIAAWDEYDIKLRVFYADGVRMEIPFREINIPIEFRSMLGQVGEHTFAVETAHLELNFNFKVVENPNFKGYTCKFFDENRYFLHSQVVGYYQDIIYDGIEPKNEYDDEEFQYHFKGWDHPLKYVHQDMQYQAVYEKLEKRNYALKVRNTEFYNIDAIMNGSKTSASVLSYIGRVKRVAAYYGPTQELDTQDLELRFNYDEIGPYINEMNNSIHNVIKYEVDHNYDSLLYGDVASIYNNPYYHNTFNQGYHMSAGLTVALEDNSRAKLSLNNPLDTLYDFILPKLSEKMVVKKSERKGYYRLAVVAAFDAYVDLSYNKLDDGKYEIGNYNYFIFAPDTTTLKVDIQYSEDGKFESTFDTYISLNTRMLYKMANNLRWE